MLASYTKCTEQQYPENIHIKTLVRPAAVEGPDWSPHHFVYKPGYHAGGCAAAGPCQ